MKQIISIIAAILYFQIAFCATQKIKGKLSTVKDTADLTILNIYPDSFPNVSVVFKAETRKGEPVWNLTKEKMKVHENNQSCQVVSIEQISKNKPINLGIVIDHSGSMELDKSQLFDKDGTPLYTMDSNYNMTFPQNYVAPIEKAKAAVKTFVSSFNIQKDSISIISFGYKVDCKLALTQDINAINSLIDSLRANGSTALYDAMLKSLSLINNSMGVKVLVVLTDGQDNSSISKWNDVVYEATKNDIPIYIIGLGDVNGDTLKMIASATKGQFYFTQSSKSLDTIYAKISKKVQAFYNLVYSSTNFSTADSTRQIELSFDTDSLFLITNKSSANFPTEVMALLERKEQDKEKQREYMMYAGIAIVLLIAIGSLLLYVKRRNKKNIPQPVIKQLYPNPTNGIINLEYEGAMNAQLQIVDLMGNVVKSMNISSNERQFDLSDLKNGNYIAAIQSENGMSNSVQLVIQN